MMVIEMIMMECCFGGFCRGFRGGVWRVDDNDEGDINNINNNTNKIRS